MINWLKKYIDFKLIGILSMVYFVFVIIYAMKNTFMINYRGLDYNWSKFIFRNIFDWFLITTYMVFIAATTKYFFKKKTKLIYFIFIHLFFSFFIGAFTLGITWLVENFNKPTSTYSESLNSIFISFIGLIDIHFLIYLSLATMIYIYYYFRQAQESKLQAIKLQDQLSKSHLKFLQSQMHPHFLFNTLNGIHSLMDINITKSKTMIVDLSDLLRNVLDKKDENLIELQEELSILKKYINIKKTRFSDQLKIHINIEKDLENILVPNMLIQPIIENATKHGYNKNHTTIEITISIAKKDNRLSITIENNGKLLTENLSTLLKKGSGLNNIKERLITLYKNEHQFSIYNSADKVITKISFPIKLSISEISNEY